MTTARDERLRRAPAPPTVDELRRRLTELTRDEMYSLFGRVDDEWVDYAADFFWDEALADPRLDELSALGFHPGSAQVLDLAAGCGQFVLRALDRGYDCVGVEPAAWKLAFIRDKLEATGRPLAQAARVVDAVGERLPFASDSFDVVTSYQTMEHVQDPARVVSEMVRVTRPGGGILIRCPDYRSTFEAHYRLPWLPLLARPVAKAMLRAIGRPTVGLDTLQYTTPGRIRGWFTAAERRSGARLIVEDMNQVLFANALRRRGLPQPPGSYLGFRLARHLGSAFRAEQDVHVFARVRVK